MLTLVTLGTLELLTIKIVSSLVCNLTKQHAGPW